MAQCIDGDLLDRPVVRCKAEVASSRAHILDSCWGQHRGVSFDYLPGRRRTYAGREPSLACAILCDGIQQSSTIGANKTDSPLPIVAIWLALLRRYRCIVRLRSLDGPSPLPYRRNDRRYPGPETRRGLR